MDMEKWFNVFAWILVALFMIMPIIAVVMLFPFAKTSVCNIHSSLAKFLEDTLVSKYVPSVLVSASLDGGDTYAASNLKHLPVGKDFYLKFEISISRKGIGTQAKWFPFTITDGIRKMTLVEYDCKYESKEKGVYPFTISLTKSFVKNSIIFLYKCADSSSDNISNTPLTLKITSPGEDQTNQEKDKGKLEPLNKTIVLVFESKPASENDKTTKIDIEGNITVKTK